MASLGTNCGKCQFFKDGTCSLGKIQEFENNGANIVYIDDVANVDRVCVFRRTHDWEPLLSFNEKVSKVNSETYICGTIIVIMKDDNKEELIKTIEGLSLLNNIHNFKIVISFSKTNKMSEIAKIASSTIHYGIDYTCVQIIEESDPLYIDEAFRRAKNGFIFVVQTGFDIDKEMIDKVNSVINKKMKRLAYVSSGHYFHGNVYSAVVYNFLKGHKEVPFDKKFEYVTQSQEIKNLSMSWEEVNECIN